jgi:hypothetical protein
LETILLAGQGDSTAVAKILKDSVTTAVDNMDLESSDKWIVKDFVEESTEQSHSLGDTLAESGIDVSRINEGIKSGDINTEKLAPVLKNLGWDVVWDEANGGIIDLAKTKFIGTDSFVGEFEELLSLDDYDTTYEQ